MMSKPLAMGDAVQVIGPSSDGSTFARYKATTIVDVRTCDDGATVYACPVRGWGVVNFPSESLVPMQGSMYRWEVGDKVWLRSGDSQYPAVITGIADYTDTHSNGYVCQQYYADVTFSQETVTDALVSHCMLSAREDGTP